MIAAAGFCPAPDASRSRFLTLVLPRVEQHARIYFRHVRCHVKKEDWIAETVALAFQWFLGLEKRGKDATQFPSTLASFAAKAVRSGRRICGQEKARDVLSERAQQRHGFYVGKLPDFSTESTNPLAEALTDNTRSPVPEQVCFRCDFPAWLKSRCRRDRKLIQAMAMSERTKELADRFQLSPARISQLRGEFCDDWERFTDDDRDASSVRSV